jgi:Domain of unknown function (DUF6285)
MQDPPRPAEIIEPIVAFLRTIVPRLEGHEAFQMRVTVSALELIGRELTLAPASDAAELSRLVALIERDGSLADLNSELEQRIARGEIDLAKPGLKEHLWASVMAKLAVDQPRYASYQRALGAQKKPE